MKKVLAIAPYSFLPACSGGHRYIEGWYQALSAHTQLTVISTADNKPDSNSTYRILPLLSSSFFRYTDVTLRATIGDLVKRNQYDLLVWEHPHYAWLASLVKKDTGTPFLLRTHNIEYQRFKSLHKIWWPLLEQYEKWGFQQADSISFISNNDKTFATTAWNINPSRCIEIPYGIPFDKVPANKAQASQLIRERHGITQQEKIILFNGPLNYKPNREALELIIQFIEPLLQGQIKPYRIIICGGLAPKRWKHRNTIQNNPYIETGFVADINNYIMAADLLLNPIQKGGGVKTKIIEAISLGTPVLTTITGAIGIDSKLTGDYMQVLKTENWDQWASTIARILLNTSFQEELLTDFFEHYNWENIITRVLKQLPN